MYCTVAVAPGERVAVKLLQWEDMAMGTLIGESLIERPADAVSDAGALLLCGVSFKACCALPPITQANGIEVGGVHSKVCLAFMAS